MSEKLMPNSKIPTRERIIRISGELFLRQGYGETGLNQIVAEANTVKASLYQHFKSKEELGTVVLQRYSTENLSLLGELMEKYPNPQDFVNAWVRILKREAKRYHLFGCPMANFRSQISESSPDILSSIQEITETTIEMMKEYLISAQNNGYIKKNKDTEKFARYLFLSYEGVLQLWRLTGDLKSLDDLPDIVQRLFD
jgi:TetR/AcrR family transcriptional repressor of lmrAB and yxaGH operons